MLQVQLSPTQGTRGQAVHAQARSDAVEVSQVQLVVDAMGTSLNWSLRREGDVWVADARVPYDAPPGTYRLSFRAYNGAGQLVESANRSFTVL